MGKTGEDGGDRLPGVLARRDRRQFDLRMVQQQPHQFGSGITGGSHNRYFPVFHLSQVDGGHSCTSSWRHFPFILCSAFFNALGGASVVASRRTMRLIVRIGS